jgi:hypothetical protein
VSPDLSAGSKRYRARPCRAGLMPGCLHSRGIIKVTPISCLNQSHFLHPYSDISPSRLTFR